MGRLNAEAFPSGSSWYPAENRQAVVCEVRALRGLELVASYRLRHEVYGGLGYIKNRNRSRLEIDGYDSFSIPFGAFEARSGRLVGTLRLITDKVQPVYARAICQLLADRADPDLTDLATQPRLRSFPSIVSPEIGGQLEALNAGGFAVKELSRTIVRPESRGLGVASALMEFGIAWAALHDPAVLVGGCLAQHLPMYAKYGYVELPGSKLEYYDSVGRRAHAVACRTDELPEPTRTHVDELLRLMRISTARRMHSYVPPVYHPDRNQLRPEERS